MGYRPVDWQQWIQHRREYWERRRKSEKDYYGPNKSKGYVYISDFPSEKLRVLALVEKDIADGYSPKPNMVEYLNQCTQTQPPQERRIGVLDWERRRR